MAELVELRQRRLATVTQLTTLAATAPVASDAQSEKCAQRADGRCRAAGALGILDCRADEAGERVGEGLSHRVAVVAQRRQPE